MFKNYLKIAGRNLAKKPGRYLADQLQHKSSTDHDEAKPPVEFIAVCVLAFVAGGLATAYFSRSMCCGMEMPGGWTMSMKWMRMPGIAAIGSVLFFV
jgi:hypothetical protein